MLGRDPGLFISIALCANDPEASVIIISECWGELMVSSALENMNIQCPYCGESMLMFIETTVGDQEYVEDCQVCCQPILMLVSVNGGDITSVEAVRENE